MKKLIYISFVAVLTSCSVTGKDTSLVLGSGLWEENKSFGQTTYRYKCQSGYTIELPKISLQNEVYSAGPILPVIPIMGKGGIASGNLSMSIRINGNITEIKNSVKEMSFSLLTNEESYIPEKKITYLENSVVIYLEYPVLISKLENFILKNSAQVSWCNIPAIEYRRVSKKYAEFIAGPGP